MNILEAKNIVKVYIQKRDKVWAVNDVSFAIKEGETLALVGESGSGKTTIARCVLRLTDLTDGEIYFQQEKISDLPPGRFRRIRPQVQTVFQEPGISLNPRKKIGYIITRPLRLWGNPSSQFQIENRIKDLTERFNLSVDLLDRYPSELTAGQQQKVAIIRAIVTNPRLLVLDEPTSSLDCVSRIEIISLLAEIQKELGLSYLYISHDLAMVGYIAHRIAVMYLGKIVELAPKETIIDNPFHPYSKALIASSLPAQSERKISGRDLLRGEIPSPINLPKGCYLYSRCPEAEPECGITPQKLEATEKDHLVACSKKLNVKRKDSTETRQENKSSGQEAASSRHS